MARDTFEAKAEEAKNEDTLAWLPKDHPERDDIRFIARGLKAIRNEVVEHIVALTGNDRILRTLDNDIANRLSELEACGIDPADDGILEELQSLRIAAGRQAVMQVIDHPTVQWILEAKSKRMKELKKHAKEVLKSFEEDPDAA